MWMYTAQILAYLLAWRHMHSMDLYVRSHVRVSPDSLDDVSMLLKMEMKVCHWVNGALIQIDRTSLFCTTDALALDMNRYLGLSPHSSSGTSLVRFRFHFRFLPPLIRLTLPRNDSLASKDALILSTCRNHGSMRKIEI